MKTTPKKIKKLRPVKKAIRELVAEGSYGRASHVDVLSIRDKLNEVIDAVNALSE